LQHFIASLQSLPAELRPQTIEEERVSRGMDGGIIVPVTVLGAEPNLSLALLMAQKAEQLYRQTSYRLHLAQRAVGDPTGLAYVWGQGTWRPLP
jgi:hypothetical protein